MFSLHQCLPFIATAPVAMLVGLLQPAPLMDHRFTRSIAPSPTPTDPIDPPLFADLRSPEHLRLNAALCTFQTLFNFCQSTGDAIGAATTLNYLSRIHQQLNQPEAALSCQQSALEFYSTIQDTVGEATSLSQMGRIYERSGQLSRALECYELALGKMRVDPDHPTRATTLKDLALLIGGMF